MGELGDRRSPSARKVRASSTDELLERLGAERIETWFDLGLLLDRIREARAVPSARAPANRRAFDQQVAEGIAFVTFAYAVDGVTMEVLKYAAAFERNLPDPKIHFVAGNFDPRAKPLFKANARQHTIAELDGFGECPLYRSFFRRRLERGSPLYNRLIGQFWEFTLDLVERLGRLIETQGIKLIFGVNTNSNPGNPALALSLVLLSEYLGIPVISNNHDFYWEGGHSDVERDTRDLPKGPRDHFFTNAHLGEVFSIVQMTYPWEGRSWFSLNLSAMQCAELINKFGHNPANVGEVGTAVEVQGAGRLPRARRGEVLRQLSLLLGGDGRTVPVRDLGRSIDQGQHFEPPHVPGMFGDRSKKGVVFVDDNIILLQPTRIISRKRIGLTFELLEGLLNDPEFGDALRVTPSLKLTLIVTGPVADGQQTYLNRLLESIRRRFKRLPGDLRDRVYFAPLFAGIDASEFLERFEQPVTIADLYGVASLACLPSETEGRGLPVIEAAALGTPCLVRRYQPEAVYSALIGEHLAAADRLQVIEFSGQHIGHDVVEQVRDLFLRPLESAERLRHNRIVVANRFSMAALTRDLEQVINRLRIQLQSNRRPRARAATALRRFRKMTHSGGRHAADLIDTRNREYLPGYGRMAFMLMLKSLIDPSYFRVEEQRIRGMAFGFARELVAGGHEPHPASIKARRDFYDSVDSLFLCHAGEMPVMFDHALAYRHRNRIAYPYRMLTPQELFGVINGLHHECCTVEAPLEPLEALQHFTNWGRALEQLCGSRLAIDQRHRLQARLAEDRSFAFFPGRFLQPELELFVVHAVRKRIGLGAEEPLTRRHLDEARIAPIFVMVRRSPCGDAPTTLTLKRFLADTPNEELRSIFRSRVCRIVATHQLSPGVDVRQLGRKAIAALREIKAAGGFLLAGAEQAAMTTDILDIERFHVDRGRDPFSACVMGIEPDQGFVQWVPAGLRFTLAYPTPIQTGLSLAGTLEGPRFRKLCDRLGEPEVLEHLRRDAAERGSPVEWVLDNLEAAKSKKRATVRQQAINGVYDDGHPWSGNLAQVQGKLRFRILSSDTIPRTALDFVTEFAHGSRSKARIAWNGGYILNAELVGKLGLPESYIGSPLGLIISDGRVVCPPLYNKPALLVMNSGELEMRRVSCEGGLILSSGASEFRFGPNAHNPERPGREPCYYDLLFAGKHKTGGGRKLVRLVGRRIMQVLEINAGDSVPNVPVGLLLSFPAGALPAGFVEGAELDIRLPEFEDVTQAVEAGPLLVDAGKVSIDMEVEGWKRSNSIQTQAARLDYLDMRGPKIAAGLDADGRLMVLTVNGRIRESVGATHLEMAEILCDRGAVSAMGFDPGGSSTLVVGREQINISPYNHAYERNVFALPPEPRPVANIVIGY